jgi:NADPH:quinone reductase-like Zn-dependent oxidoreductase
VRAAVIKEARLVVRERPDPVPTGSELLVAVAAAGLNGADLLQRAGHYPPPPGVPADIPGLECAGTVVATGPDAERAIGDRVMGIVGGGAQAELCLVEDSVAMAVPGSVSLEEAGGFPETFTTAHDALFTQCGLAAGERVLVTGAAGGVGVAAVQLAKLKGSQVVASVRRAELRPAVAALGAEVIDPAEEEAAGPYDVVLELVGAADFPAHLAALATGGRICFIGLAGSGPHTGLDARQLMAKRAVVRGSTLRARSVAEKAAATRALAAEAGPALGEGRLKVLVAATYPLADCQAAYDRFAEGGKLGKILLLMGQER